MIRVIKNKEKEYLVINTFLEILEKENSKINVPVNIRIELTNFTEDKRIKVYRVAYKLFDRIINVNLIKQKESKKPWWKKIFN
jgi:hypothetical protein